MSAESAPGRRMLNVATYRGREGQLSWLIHRVAGLGILAFLALHIVDIWVMGLGREQFDSLLILYTWPPFKIMELFLIFGVLFHAVNGLRIILVDFVPAASRNQRRMFWLEVALVLVVMIPATIATLGRFFQ
jgi:succinate dehydrogenase / fumarate reductase cytochrome b subunit